MTKHRQVSVKTTLNIRGRLISLDKPVVMGIINSTPDSFYAGSRANGVAGAVAKAGEMLAEGAVFLDVGGYSTRPGAAEISEAEEMARVVPVIKAIRKEFPQALISIDTFRASVAREAVMAGALMINDITAGGDPGMFPLVKETGLPYIMMHMRGPVSRMMENLKYANLILEITRYFLTRLHQLRQMDITTEVIIDPGFGFSKTLAQNYEILKNLTYFEALEAPLLVGVSRKSMIYKVLGTTADDALIGTSVINFAALEKGARILRVHDVKEAIDTIKIFNKLNG